MQTLHKYAQHFLNQEIIKVGLEVFQNEMERSGIQDDLEKTTKKTA